MAFDATGFAQEFGAQVRAVRKYEKITQMELAWMVGLSDKTIRDIERGLPGPSIGAVLKVAQELGIELAITNPPHLTPPAHLYKGTTMQNGRARTPAPRRRHCPPPPRQPPSKSSSAPEVSKPPDAPAPPPLRTPPIYPCSWSPAAAAPTPSPWRQLPRTSPAAATCA